MGGETFSVLESPYSAIHEVRDCISDVYKDNKRLQLESEAVSIDTVTGTKDPGAATKLYPRITVVPFYKVQWGQWKSKYPTVLHSEIDQEIKVKDCGCYLADDKMMYYCKVIAVTPIKTRNDKLKI